ncbi:MAG: dihydrolipoyl dehydrogenase [Conexivisphaera sp.]|jgi:dihydrolipoamide dehydrogenase
MLGKYPVFPPTDQEFLDPPRTEEYDVVIVGAGGAGYHGAFELSKGGRRVLMVDDKGNLGGNCLYEGCIPSKAIAMTVYLMEKVRGILESVGSRNAGAPALRAIWEDAVSHKDDVQTIRYHQHIREIKEHGNLEFVKGIARVLDEHRVVVEDLDGSWRKEVRGRNLIIAQGSVPLRPPIRGSELTIGSLELFGYRTSFRRMPDSLVVVGGGYIGVEASLMAASAGRSVTLLEMLPSILSGWDEDVVNSIGQELSARGVKVMTNSKVTEIRSEGSQKVVEYVRPDGSRGTAVGDEVVMAAGRMPYVEGLEHLGIIQNGRAVVEPTMETKRNGVYATGDLLGKFMLFHAAVKESTIAAWNILHGHPVYEVNFNSIPQALFTEPEAAYVGVTPAAARKAGIPHSVVSYDLADDAYAQIMGVRKGWVKIVVERETQRIIGGLILGEAASLLINEVALAIATNSKVKDLALLAHQHPTIFESIDRAAIRFSL